jgi:hypothetical protein
MCSGLPLTELSYNTRIPTPTLYDFRNGRQDLAMKNMQKLCDYFRLHLVPMDESPRSSR